MVALRPQIFAAEEWMMMMRRDLAEEILNGSPRRSLLQIYLEQSPIYIYGGSEINIDRGGRPRVNHVSNFEVSRVIFSVNGESAGISIRISFAGAGVCACSCDRKEIR